jgi:hypothetical protein
MKLVLALILIPAAYAQVDTFKQVLTQKLMALKPSSVSERNVLFVSVSPAGAGQFKATANIRDYSAGYPKNRFFGETCVGQLNYTYRMFAGDGGQWMLDGPLTPSLDARQCKPNPSEGVSSIPLASVSGTPATGTAAAAAGANAPGTMAAGSYECWANGQARMLMNFNVTSGSSYSGQGKAGTYSIDASGRLTFRGGNLDGAMPQGFYARYYAPGGRPTVSFVSPRGAEAAFCQKVK